MTFHFASWFESPLFCFKVMSFLASALAHLFFGQIWKCDWRSAINERTGRQDTPFSSFTTHTLILPIFGLNVEGRLVGMRSFCLSIVDFWFSLRSEVMSCCCLLWCCWFSHETSLVEYLSGEARPTYNHTTYRVSIQEFEKFTNKRLKTVQVVRNKHLLHHLTLPFPGFVNEKSVVATILDLGVTVYLRSWSLWSLHFDGYPQEIRFWVRDFGASAPLERDWYYNHWYMYRFSLDVWSLYTPRSSLWRFGTRNMRQIDIILYYCVRVYSYATVSFLFFRLWSNGGVLIKPFYFRASGEL